MRTLTAGCGCDDSACEFSRIREGYEIRAVPYAEPDNGAVEVTSVVVNTAQTLAAPTSDWLELAVVTLPVGGTGGSTALTSQDIDNSVRRLI